MKVELKNDCLILTPSTAEQEKALADWIKTVGVHWTIIDGTRVAFTGPSPTIKITKVAVPTKKTFLSVLRESLGRKVPFVAIRDQFKPEEKGMFERRWAQLCSDSESSQLISKGITAFYEKHPSVLLNG